MKNICRLLARSWRNFLVNPSTNECIVFLMVPFNFLNKLLKMPNGCTSTVSFVCTRWNFAPWEIDFFRTFVNLDNNNRWILNQAGHVVFFHTASICFSTAVEESHRVRTVVPVKIFLRFAVFFKIAGNSADAAVIF